jgi:hypothetical protein
VKITLITDSSCGFHGTVIQSEAKNLMRNLPTAVILSEAKNPLDIDSPFSLS